MGEALRDPEHLEFACFVMGFEVEACPSAEVRRIATKIDGDVPDVSGEDANEFSLGLSQLIVQPPKDASGRKRLVILNKRRR
jgi:hypothetical protein